MTPSASRPGSPSRGSGADGGFGSRVVDLDFWNPTVVRPRPHPNEGLLDVLEYGCSFRRVAWEIVADGLWLIGPGSHPPDPDRIVDHPDWERAARGLASHVDVTFFVAPLLDRRGFVGRLSKRMDGVLLAASIERIGRAELKDAFLELWGSDAPIIGCVGIEPTAEPRRFRAERPPEETPAAPLSAAPAPAASPAPEASSAPGAPPTRTAHEPAAGPAPMAPTPASRADRPSPARHRVDPRVRPESVDEPDDHDLAAVLDREVRLGGTTYRRPRRRSRAGLIAGIAVGALVAASIGVVVLRRPDVPLDGETLPAGTERVLPVQPEATPPPDANSEPTLPPSQVEPAPPPSTTAGGETPGAPTSDARGIPPTAPTPDTPFRVHVASFKSEEKVQELVRQLRLRGADAWYESAANSSGYYRVFVGHFATEAEARAHAQWLLDNGWVDRAQAYPSTPR